jgi:hypothetical protein
MMFLPAGRLLTGPFPPGLLAARVFAAVILPPLVFFISSLPHCVWIHRLVAGSQELMEH